MKNSTKLSDTIHLLAAVQIIREIAERRGLPLKGLLSSAALAESIHTNPGYVRQLMMLARKAHLLLSERGKSNPSLARPAKDISLLDIYRTVAGEKSLLTLDAHINPECRVGVAIQHSLSDAYRKIQSSAESEMAKISLQDIINGYYARTGGDALPD